MLISARGWSRNSGENYIGSGELNQVNVIKDKVYPRATKGFNTIYSQEDGVIITWKADLRLGGNYKVNLSLSKPELALLFKAAFGEEIGIETLRSLGIKLKKEALRDVISEMKVGEVFSLIGADGLSAQK